MHNKKVKIGRMKVLLTTIVFLFPVLVHSQEINLDSLRKDYYEVIHDASLTDTFFTKVYGTKDSSAIVEAYRGAAWALRAKVAWNPMAKLSYLKKSQKALEVSIGKDSSNLEIRFIRYSIQFHLPGYLGMSNDMEEDFSLIKTNLINYASPDLPSDIAQFIVKFVIDSGQCTDEELHILKEKFNVVDG